MKTLFVLNGGVWQATEEKAVNPEYANFRIVCDYGDWSGFRTLKACLDQVPNWQNRRPGFFRIVTD